MSRVKKKGTRSNVWNKRFTNVLIFYSLHSLNLSFSLLSYVIATAILKIPHGSLHHHPDSPQFHISIRILRIPTLIPRNCIPIPFLTFPPLFSVFPLFHFPIPLFGFYRQLAQFVTFKNLFYKNSCFSSKANTPLCYYCITFCVKLLFTPSMTSSVLSSKIIYLIVPQVKNL